MDKRINFEVDDFQIVEDDSNSQFATFECDICRSGQNTHRLPISKEAIKKSASSAKGKPILAEFRWDGQDFLGHEVSEMPMGFTAEDVEPQLVEKDDGELYIRTTGKIWKRYFSNAMDILKNKDGKTDVSMEMVMLKGKEPIGDVDGCIDLFSIMGITMLGVPPSIKGSELRVLSFSEMMDEYNKETKTALEKFTEDRTQNLSQTYKVNKTELKETAWGDVDKNALRDKIMSATNKASLVKQVYALVEDGWQTAPSEHLKYPLMQLDGDTLYYNKGALSSALAYAKQEKEQSVINKITKLYERFNLETEEDMAELKDKTNPAEIEAEEKVENPAEGEKKLEAEEEAMAETEEKTEEAMADEDKTEEPEPEKEEKGEEGDDKEGEDFAEEDGLTFAMALTQLMDCETAEERKAFCGTTQFGEDENIVMERVCKGCDELGELRAFKEEILAEKTKQGVAEALASVKPSLTSDDFATLEKKGEEVKYEDLEAFQLQTKAFAFEHMTTEAKTAQEDEIIRMGIVNNEQQPKNVFERILGK